MRGVYRAYRVFSAGLVMALGLCCGIAAQAQAPASSPEGFVRKLGAEVIAVLANDKLDIAQRKSELHDIFLRSFDSKAMARFALGRYWRVASAKQRHRYLKVFPVYVADIYAGRLSTYAGETFVVLRSRTLDSGKSMVNTEIRRPDGGAFKVDFRVHAEGNGFKNTDVLVEGVSLLVTKRDEFAAVIRRSGLEALISALERRTGS